MSTQNRKRPPPEKTSIGPIPVNAMSDQDKEVVRKEKQKLRKEIRRRMRDLSAQQIMEQSQMVWNKLKDSPVYQHAKSIGVFLSMPKGEINTDGLLHLCTADKKTIYVPQVGEDFEKAHMDLLKVQSDGDENTTTHGGMLFYEKWPRNKWNIPEPPTTMPIETAKPGDLDLLVVPGLAFDMKGQRLGQGKGYYDRFIERMSTRHLDLVAVCLDCQLVKDSTIPVLSFDKPMHMILSPTETIVIVDESESTRM